MHNVSPPHIVVDGQVIPGPLGLGESLRYWAGPESTPDQPTILCITGRTRRTTAFWFRADGLNDHQRARLSALPCIPDLDRTGNRFSLFCVKTADRQHVAEVLVDVLSITAPIPDNLDDLPFYDIDDAPLSDRWKCFIFLGHDRVNPNKYESDSEGVMACATKMVQRGMANPEIAYLLWHHKINAHLKRQGSKAWYALNRVIRKARGQYVR